MDDYYAGKWTKPHRADPYERDGQVADDVEVPDFIIPRGWRLTGWLDYEGNIWPAFKFAVFPFFERIEE